MKAHIINCSLLALLGILSAMHADTWWQSRKTTAFIQQIHAAVTTPDERRASQKDR